MDLHWNLSRGVDVARKALLRIAAEGTDLSDCQSTITHERVQPTGVLEQLTVVVFGGQPCRFQVKAHDAVLVQRM